MVCMVLKKYVFIMLSISFLVISNTPFVFLITASFEMIVSEKIMCNDSQICFLSGNNSFRVHHCECIAKVVFLHVHYFEFIDTEFHLPFYYPIIQFLELLF